MELSNSITYQITKTGSVLRQLSARRLKDAEVDLTPEESVLMNQLWDKDNQTMSELNIWAVKEASTLTRQIDKLVRKGYVSRSHGKEDRRTVTISLTDAGRKLQKAFQKTAIGDMDSDLVSVSDQDARKLLALLNSIREKAQAQNQR